MSSYSDKQNDLLANRNQILSPPLLNKIFHSLNVGFREKKSKHYNLPLIDLAPALSYTTFALIRLLLLFLFLKYAKLSCIRLSASLLRLSFSRIFASLDPSDPLGLIYLFPVQSSENWIPCMVTICPNLPGTFLVFTCCSKMVINNASFYSQERPSLDDELQSSSTHSPRFFLFIAVTTIVIMNVSLCLVVCHVSSISQ